MYLQRVNMCVFVAVLSLFPFSCFGSSQPGSAQSLDAACWSDDVDLLRVSVSHVFFCLDSHQRRTKRASRERGIDLTHAHTHTHRKHTPSVSGLREATENRLNFGAGGLEALSN